MWRRRKVFYIEKRFVLNQHHNKNSQAGYCIGILDFSMFCTSLKTPLVTEIEALPGNGAHSPLLSFYLLYIKDYKSSGVNKH